MDLGDYRMKRVGYIKPLRLVAKKRVEYIKPLRMVSRSGCESKS